MRKLFAAAAVLLFCASAHAADEKFFVDLPALCTGVAAPAIPEGYRTGIAELAIPTRPGDLAEGENELRRFIAPQVLDWYKTQISSTAYLVQAYEYKATLIGAYGRAQEASVSYGAALAYVAQECPSNALDRTLRSAANSRIQYGRFSNDLVFAVKQQVEAALLNSFYKELPKPSQTLSWLSALPLTPKTPGDVLLPTGDGLINLADRILTVKKTATPETLAKLSQIWSATEVLNSKFQHFDTALTNLGNLGDESADYDDVRTRIDKRTSAILEQFATLVNMANRL